MPSKQAHLTAAKQNQVTLDYLLKNDDHLAWAATVAFYKAMHIIEAVFAGDAQSLVAHTDDHKVRNRILKTTNRYRQLWRMYRPLWEASLIARYLRSDDHAPTYEIFSQYMNRDDVEQRVVGHYLAQIEKSAATLLGDPNLMA